MSPPIAPGILLFLSLRKKSGKWRLLQDLRAINATMEDMGTLQPGLPSPVAVPEGHNIIVIDLQDCFFTVPLNTEDKKRLSENLKQPYLRFQWKVLPQGMKNSRILCQKFESAICEDKQSQTLYLKSKKAHQLILSILQGIRVGRIRTRRQKT